MVAASAYRYLLSCPGCYGNDADKSSLSFTGDTARSRGGNELTPVTVNLDVSFTGLHITQDTNPLGLSVGGISRDLGTKEMDPEWALSHGLGCQN